ncbi:MAG: hypothetical protein KY434_05335, partial [Actinobacteria bacterium]|nr:hypothetical protein [Actinomycetota bacterium]
MSSARAARQLALLLAAELAAAAGLLRLGSPSWLRMPRHDVLGWLAAAPVEDAAVACLRLVAIATLAWLLAGTLLYAVARAFRVRPAARALGWLTLPAARRLVDRALAVTLATSFAVNAGAPVLARQVTPPPPGVAPGRLADRPVPQARAAQRPGLSPPTPPPAPAPARYPPPAPRGPPGGARGGAGGHRGGRGPR